MKLDELLSLPKSGVVVLIKHPGVLVSYTSSMASELMELYSNFKGQIGIELRVFSAGADIETLKLHTEYYRKHYHDRLGYKPILPYNRKTIQYKVRAIPSQDFKAINVELVNARGEAKTVGQFKNTKEANEFIVTYYGSDNPLRLPVYALNKATRDIILNSVSVF